MLVGALILVIALLYALLSVGGKMSTSSDGMEPKLLEFGGEKNLSSHSGDQEEGRTSLSNPENDPEDSVISGQVLDSKGKAILGAQVALVQAEAFDGVGMRRSYLAEKAKQFSPCRSNGKFRLPVPGRGGEWRVLARAEGFAWKRSPPLFVGEEVQLELKLQVVLEGSVLSGDGMPVESAALLLRPSKGMVDDMPPLTLSDERGEFRLLVPGDGKYRLEVRSSEGPDWVLDPIEVRSDMKPLVIQIDGRPDLKVQVISANGEPIPRTRVELQATKKSMAGNRVSWTNSEGWTSFSSIPPGSYWLVAEKENHVRLRQGFRWQEGDNVDFREIVLPLGANAHIQVLDKNGEPVPDFDVLRHSLNRARVRDEASNQMVTDAEGRVHWRGIFPGEYIFLGGGSPRASQRQEDASAEEGSTDVTKGRAPSTLRAQLAGGENPELRLILDGHALILFQFFHPDLDLEGGQVGLFPIRQSAKSKPLSKGAVNAQGVAPMSPVPPGDYELHFQLPNRLGNPACIIPGVRVKSVDEVIEIALPKSWLAGQIQPESTPVFVELLPEKGNKVIRSLSFGLADTFRIDLLSEGAYRIRVSGQGLLPWSSPPIRLDGESGIHLGAIALEAAASVGGVVLGLPPMKKNAFNIRLIQVLDSTGGLLRTASLDESGSFLFEGLPPGEGVLRVQIGMKVALERSFSLEGGGSLELQLEL
jgi:protocatechuate 3,4-dioxygenase beta subunit|tara:strand:+ start:12377 stop:14482 length:2106 start_codon:yes stop_codon:yes gene_type:complete